MKRLDTILGLGYEIKIIWESDWRDFSNGILSELIVHNVDSYKMLVEEKLNEVH